jgi:hypothetical protein
VSAKTADAALKVEMPDGSNLENDDSIGSDARLQLEVTETGTAWIGASVILRDEQLREDLNVPYQVYVRDYQPPVKSLVLGQAGALTPFIPVAEDLSPLPEPFTFTAPKAGVYRFRMDGRDGAIPVLHGTTDAGRLLGDTAERNARDYAQIRCYLRQNQRLDLVAESLPGGTRQHFSLAVQYESPGVFLRDGDNVERELQDPRQGFYVYRGRAGESVEFLMTSDDFETRLLASDPLGQTFTWSKYYGSDFSYASLGGYWFDQAGELLLETGGKNAGDDGLYQISVRSSLSGGLPLPREPAPRSLLGSGVPVYFRLTDRSLALPDGYGSEFQMDLKAQDLVSLRLQSWDVAARLQVFGPDGLELADGGGQPVKDNTLELVAPRAGRYLVRCSVPVEAGKPLNATASVVFDIVGSALPLDNDLVNRSCELLPQTDRQGSETAMYDLPLRLRSAQHLYATVVSGDFLPVLKLLDKDGIVVEENHGRGPGEASRIDFVIQKGGNYRLRILSAGLVGPAVPAGASAASPRCQVSVYEIR